MNKVTKDNLVRLYAQGTFPSVKRVEKKQGYKSLDLRRRAWRDMIASLFRSRELTKEQYKKYVCSYPYAYVRRYEKNQICNKRANELKYG